MNNKTLLRKWLKVIPLKHGKGLSVYSRICSEHFPGRKKQSRDDIPSLFPQTSTADRVRARPKPTKNGSVESKRKWPKMITKVKLDHTYAQTPNLLTSEHHRSTPTSSYLTVIESKDLNLQCKEVKNVGTMCYTDTDNSIIMQDASTSTGNEATKTCDIGIEVNIYFCIDQNYE